MKRLLLSATVLACLPAALQAELPGHCVPGYAPKQACQTLLPRQMCPQTCAPQHSGCRLEKRCLIKESLGRLHSACPLKTPACPLKTSDCPLKLKSYDCPLKSPPCNSGLNCQPLAPRPGCLTRLRDGACRLIPRPVRSACKSVCNVARPRCATDPCCDVKRIVIHTQPCCPPQRQPCCVNVRQPCCVHHTCQVGQGGVMVVPQMATSSQQELDDRLTRLEAEVSSLVRQVELQNELIQRR